MEQRVLIAEGAERLRIRLEEKLRNLIVSFDSVDHGRDAIAKLNERAYAMMVLDLGLPGGDGVAVIDRIRGLRASDRPMLLVTATRESLPLLDTELVQMVLRKPYDARQIAEVIANCLRAVDEHRKRMTPRVDETRDRAGI